MGQAFREAAEPEWKASL